MTTGVLGHGVHAAMKSIFGFVAGLTTPSAGRNLTKEKDNTPNVTNQIKPALMAFEKQTTSILCVPQVFITFKANFSQLADRALLITNRVLRMLGI